MKSEKPCIYICYSRSDTTLVYSVINELNAYLYEKTDIVVSEEPDLDRVEESDIIICMITNSFAGSKEALHELKSGSDLNKTIIGIDLQDVPALTISDKVKMRSVKSRIRSGIYHWTEEDSKASLVLQLIGALGLEQPICKPIGNKICLSVKSTYGFMIRVDDAIREYPTGCDLLLFFDIDPHKVIIQSSKYKYCSIEELITAYGDLNLKYDLDAKLQEVGFEGEVKSEGFHYVGWIRNNCFNGHGILTTASGDVFEGDFLEGVLPSGSLRDKNRNLYYGSFCNLKRDGFGKQIFATGHRYEGEWRDNQFSGTGKLLAPSETEFVGLFKKHKFVEGKIIYPDGSVYEGQSSSWRRHGIGKLISKNGTIFSGLWENDDLVS